MKHYQKARPTDSPLHQGASDGRADKLKYRVHKEHASLTKMKYGSIVFHRFFLPWLVATTYNAYDMSPFKEVKRVKIAQKMINLRQEMVSEESEETKQILMKSQNHSTMCQNEYTSRSPVKLFCGTQLPSETTIIICSKQYWKFSLIRCSYSEM